MNGEWSGMEVVKVGGPVYRIGVGGGAASSVGVQGDNSAELDFGAVQRGDAEMEQKMNRVLRACIESTDNNIICSIHDQGAGGNGELESLESGLCLVRPSTLVYVLCSLQFVAVGWATASAFGQ